MFIHLFMTVLGLFFTAQGLSLATSRGYSLVVVRGLLIAVVSLVAASALVAGASVITSCGLNTCGSRALKP